MASLIDSAGRRFTIRSDRPTRVGSDLGGDVMLAHGSVSPRHATIANIEGRYHIRDLDSTNGTFVSGRKIADSEMSDGDRIRFGSVELTFRTEDGSSPRRNANRVEPSRDQPSASSR